MCLEVLRLVVGETVCVRPAQSTSVLSIFEPSPVRFILPEGAGGSLPFTLCNPLLSGFVREPCREISTEAPGRFCSCPYRKKWLLRIRSRQAYKTK
jgi:hypothetical protein